MNPIDATRPGPAFGLRTGALYKQAEQEFASGDYASAIHTLGLAAQQALFSESWRSADLLIRKAQAHEKLQQWQAAAVLYQQLRSDAPTCSTIASHYARVLLRLNQPAVAYNIADQGLQHVPPDHAQAPDLWLSRGIAGRRINTPDRGVNDLLQVILARPQDVFAWFHVGLSYLSLGEKNLAHHYFRQAESLLPDKHAFQNHIARALHAHTAANHNLADCVLLDLPLDILNDSLPQNPPSPWPPGSPPER